jgi:hypothetical protein
VRKAFEKGYSCRDPDALRCVLLEEIGIELDAIVGRESTDIHWGARSQVAAEA